MFCVEREGSCLSISELEALTGAAFVPQLDFSHFTCLADIVKRCKKLQSKGQLARKQLWLGAYFKKELLEPPVPDVILRWIDPVIGWGVFAARDFKKMEFIAEYSGKLRRHKKREDEKNSYCFEYLLAPGIKTPYTIDAQSQGGISRYINHSARPNLSSDIATLDSICHVVLFVKEPIPKGTQLAYDYGPDYWSKRPPPHALSH